MLEAIIANLIANLISWALIGVVMTTVLVLAPVIGYLWVECWARLYPDVADHLRDHFLAEMEIDESLKRVTRALLFMVSVPGVARTLNEAERDVSTKTSGAVKQNPYPIAILDLARQEIRVLMRDRHAKGKSVHSLSHFRLLPLPDRRRASDDGLKSPNAEWVRSWREDGKWRTKQLRAPDDADLPPSV